MLFAELKCTLCFQTVLNDNNKVSLGGTHFGKLRKPSTVSILHNVTTTTTIKCKTTMLVAL